MFSDVEGSTRLLHALGDDVGPVLDRHDTIMRQAIMVHNGVVLTTEGDSFFSVFRDAHDAVAAAAAAQLALHQEQWPAGGTVAVRIGIHTGRGELGGADYRGVDVNRAARIAAAGHGGQVLLSDTTRALVHLGLRDGVTLVDLGEYRLKDFETPHRLWQLQVPGIDQDFPQLSTVPAGRVDLPAVGTSFVGRLGEMNRIGELLATTRLLTLTGPGGTGKTRLAIEVGRRLTPRYDSVAFIPLASVTEPALVAPTIAGHLAVEPGQADTVERLSKHLSGSRWLLILDNLEQVLDGAPMIGDMIAATPSLTCLATSRAGLRLDGEIEFPVPPLGGLDTPADSHSDATVLFAERARAIRPDFVIDATNADAIAAITDRLDRLPLAIELAAARMRLLAPSELAERLATSLDLLRSSRPDRPERQRTLRSTIAWSYDLLSEVQQSVFRQFAVFEGGCDLEAVESVCAVPESVDLLTEVEGLVLHSLVRADPAHSGTRFAMLVTLRAYASEQLAARGEKEEALARHHVYYASLAARAAPELLKPDRGAWLSRLAADLENLRAAMEWAMEAERATEACRMVGHLWRFWHMRGDLAEGRRWTGLALALPGAETGARMLALEAAGGLAYWAGDVAGARSPYQEALAIARVDGTEADVANALYNLGFILSFPGDWEEGDAAVDESLAIYRRLGDAAGVARLLWARGTLASIRARLDAARADFEEALGILETMDDQFQLGWTHRMLATTLLDLGEPDAARHHIRRSIDIFNRANDTSGIVLILRDAAKLALLEGDDDLGLTLAAAYHGLQDRSGLDLVDIHNEIIELDEVRARRGSERTAALEAEGGALSTEAAIALAVDRVVGP